VFGPVNNKEASNCKAIQVKCRVYKQEKGLIDFPEERVHLLIALREEKRPLICFIHFILPARSLKATTPMNNAVMLTLLTDCSRYNTMYFLRHLLSNYGSLYNHGAFLG